MLNSTDSIKTGYKNKCCSDCGASFICGLEEGASVCWCNSLPPIMPLDGQDCRCPMCLRKAIHFKITEYINSHSIKESLALASLYSTQNLTEGIDYYIESGLWVFTEWYHLKRGNCCNKGCRHCPFKKEY